MKKTIIIIACAAALIGVLIGGYFLSWFAGLGLAPVTGNSEQFIGYEAAKQIALDDQDLTADKVYHLHADFENERGGAYYEVEFKADLMEYNYYISAVSGDILNLEKEFDD